MKQTTAGASTGSLSLSHSTSGSSVNGDSPSFLGIFYASGLIVSALPFLYHKFVAKEVACNLTTFSIFCLLMTLLASSTSLCFAYQNVGISKYLALSSTTHHQPSKKASPSSLAEHDDRVELAAAYYALATVNASYICMFLVSMWIPFSCLSPRWNCILSTVIPSFTVSFIARSA